LARAHDECSGEVRLAIMTAIAHAPSLTPSLLAAAADARQDRSAGIRAAAEYATLRAGQ
jgi:hypothetical protein